ncbi:PTS transporter subunit EIIB, partial [Streptomyces sp. NPDC049577]|uniref:PTS transporter subunit EIIB n=1 Tax=Streptomyces sp. NPDC049577 TaxID=3155153 RepID=UPI00344A9A6A
MPRPPRPSPPSRPSPDDRRHSAAVATAEALLPLLGGPANIASVAACMTRLRVELHDRTSPSTTGWSPTPPRSRA